MISNFLEEFTRYQIENVSVDSDKFCVSIKIQHDSGRHAKILHFEGVRVFSVEYPAFCIDSPFLIAELDYSKLTDTSNHLKNIGYRHFNSNGTVQAFRDEPIEMFKIRIIGDINIELVFETMSEHDLEQ